MEASINSFINKRQLNKDVLKRRTAAAIMLGMVIIIAVFWWLKLTGITMAGEACCGYVEHEHSEECIKRTLICGYDEETEESVAASGFFTTAYAEDDESAAEDISDAIAIDAGEPSQEEAPPTEESEEAEEITELPDGDGENEPTASEEAIEKAPDKTEEIEETKKHVHTDECYEITYICGLEEHIHTSECYSDDEADVETEKMWEESFEDVKLTEDLAENLVEIAKTQLGYRESKRNYEIDADKEKYGYTRYGEWYGSPYGKWSAMFVEFCLYYSGIDGDSLDYYSGVERLRSLWSDEEILLPIDEHTPVFGDIIFLDEDGDDKADFAGIISDETDDEYTVIVGDYEDEVSEITVEKEDERIIGVTIAEKLLEAAQGEDTRFRVENVIDCIDNLPSFEEITETLGEYEANDDMDGYAAYFDEIYRKSFGAYVLWEDLWIYRPLVTNFDNLEMYQTFWAQPLKNVESPTVYQINTYSETYVSTVLMCGNKTIYEYTNHKNGMMYWDMYVVKKDSLGYYIADIVYKGTDKSWKTTTPPANGFLIFCYGSSDGHTTYVPETWVDIEIGDRVELNVSVDITGVHYYKAGGYGTVDKVTSNNLTPIESADTSEFITLNLYNYNSNINTKWKSDHDYPGFQQGNGVTDTFSSLGSGTFDFGDNIETDAVTPRLNVTNQGGAINAVPDGNTPVQGAMNYNLVNGYPALADSAGVSDPSLAWLFTDSSANGVTKVNSSNINGLFLYDKARDCYYFDSRLHNAQWNAKEGRIDLYDEIMSPNYMMYPFGNFLPFNDINLQTTKVTSINKSYFVGQANKAETRYSADSRTSYNVLSDRLTKFVSLMGNNFNYLDAVNAYFRAAGDGTNEKPPEEPPGDPNEVFSTLYNLDYSEPSDFFFGMSMHMNFMMTKDGTTGPNKTPLYFDFNGDDDVWVYVDNKLFLDLSGIHRHVGGRIDFQHGRVYYFAFNPATGAADDSVDTGITDANGNKYKDENGRYYVPFSVFLGSTASELIDPKTGTFYPYTNHSFDFYYMERGSGSSLCNMEFSIPVLQKNSISVTKELTVNEGDVGVLGNPDFNFQILKGDGSALFIGEGVTYSILDANTQEVVGSGITKANGVFTLKANQTAVFGNIQENMGSYFVRELLDTTVFEQYGTITVDGQSTTLDHYTNIEVGSGSFKGVNSDIKNISNGSTAFAFTNHVDITKYGALTIEKEYNEYQSGIEPQTVTLEVLMGGEPIAVGTPYQVINGAVYTNKTVEREGEVTFRSDERVVFPKLLAGTNVTIKETPQSSKGYDVSYTTSKDFDITTFQNDGEPYCEGLIPSSVALPITVHNERSGTKLHIPISKTLLHPDGTEHTYNFILERIASLSDHRADGFYIKTPISLTEGTKNIEFVLNYVPGYESGKYYYLIREEDANGRNGMDLTRYIAEVTVTTTGQATTAELTGWYNESGVPLSTQEFPFTNNVVRTLTIGKTVQGVTTDSVFKFEIRASIDGQPLNGTFYYTKDAEAGSNIPITFEDGLAAISLNHGERVTIHGLPYGTAWTVTELEAPGFFAKYKIDNGEVVNGYEGTGTLSDNATIRFYNVGGHELPSTGSSLHLWFTFSGLALMLISLVIGYLVRRRAERRLR